MNDIEKKLRKRGMQKLDKFAHNPYHVNKPSFFSRIPLWGKIMIPASLVAAVAVVAFVGLINGFGVGGRAPQAPGKNNGASNHTQQGQDTSAENRTHPLFRVMLLSGGFVNIHWCQGKHTML